MTTLDDEATTRRTAMVDELTAGDHALRLDVADAFRKEPRHAYVRRFTRSHLVDGAWVSEEVNDAHPDWLAEVYRDQVLLTSTWPTMSSSTVPSLMADMLDALDVHPGTSVTEIGTGTGYNAGLLGRLVGDENVLSIDVAPELVSAARAALEATGHDKITVICGDGSSSDVVKPNSTDRLIATCGVSTLPAAWRQAVRPGGIIVVPLGAGIAVLDVDEQHAASGAFLSTGAYFMSLRPTNGAPLMPRPDNPEGPAESCTMPVAAWADSEFTFLVSFSLGLDDVLTDTSLSGALTIWHRDGSIATVTAEGTARQAGPRRLADLLGRLWDDYQAHGRPSRSAYRIAVSPDGTHTVSAQCPSGPWAVLPPCVE
ncbi:methyltransferase domain-containing protein [Embleya sp. MST-111070]|uniref:methyltransferase domain-containing protein n=1 Tax=Embleya sp. MST-111070 TaxID=3398231 RepID=UPI003F73E1E7